MTDFPTRAAALEAVRTLLAFIGDDPTREGLRETPERVLKAWAQDWGAGYAEQPTNLVKLFEGEDPIPDAPQPRPPMVIVKDLSFHSTCEHHLAPFYGRAAIAYIPTWRGKLGLSKFARILDYFARRLQVQERLTDQIADFLAEHLSPDIAVSMQASHMCMVSRGVRQPNALTVTSALRGVFYDEASTRSEFFRATAGSQLRCD